MTAVVEIHIDHLTDVLCVPVQALVQRGDSTWCYAVKDGEIEQRFIDQGRTNDKSVEVQSGLSQGDVIVLTPGAILEQMPESDQQAEDHEGNQDTSSLPAN